MSLLRCIVEKVEQGDTMNDSRELSNEVRALRIKVDFLESHLKTAVVLPILGPGVLDSYRKALNKALAKDGLPQEP